MAGSGAYCAQVLGVDMYCTKSSVGLGLLGCLLMGVQTALAASAAPLTEVRVLKVESPACGFEDVAQDQAQTRCDHQGPNIKVYVLEQGYGRQPRVALDGLGVDGTRTRVCANASDNLVECSSTGKIVGYLYVFDLAGKQQGHFTFSNTSINPPQNTLSAQIYIK
ncbi:hypothetical protein PS723_01723 [Pseudomonas fluorescens]|uniref:DUF4879 domain-containing protein n=2 Tax=Pseudomonas fluorescens TaxID=294 RepID=A0A5E7BLQ2_PSEFL|nr:hypothetical protein PS723_01723 [Pseudomonas fluorescens]